MTEPAKPPPYRQVRYVVVAIVVVAVMGVVLAWQLRQPAEPALTAAVSPDETSVSTWTEASPPSTLPPLSTARRGSSVLWQKTASDSDVGGLFHAPNRWRIVWSFNCQNFAVHGGGNFKLTGEGDFSRVLIQRFAVKASGTQRMRGGGRGRLIIESVCDQWTVKAVAP